MKILPGQKAEETIISARPSGKLNLAISVPVASKVQGNVLEQLYLISWQGAADHGFR